MSLEGGPAKAMEIDKRKLVLLEAFYHKVRVFKESFNSIDNTRTMLAILHAVFDFVEAIERLEKEQSGAN